ncbi:MAG: hypothetical protein JKY32_15555 [Rhizobiales bacterium]|nr:hypothetical protein [Hyphomicrobiales bacterium]
MSYQATVLKIMIASPGDVIEERNQVRDIIHEWNDINSTSVNCVLMPVGWETHSSPDLGGRAQELINNRVLQDCDLLVGIFWTRLGTPTGEADSGTVEEIQKHQEAEKPVMLYFSTQPVAPESLDPDQYAALTQFKEWCRARGLTETFENISDFREKFRRQLQIILRDNPYFGKTIQSGQVTAIPINGLVNKEDESISLSEEAIELLMEVALDRSGTITSMAFMSGHAIQTNGRNFADSGDHRSIARWKHALQQLLENDFILNRGGEGQIFEITENGYQYVEEIRSA